MNRMTPAAQFQSVHPAQVAGLFYPDHPALLAAKIDAAFAAAPPSPFKAKMVVVPHAGIDYSGAVAAQALRALDRTGGLRRVVILGPNHRAPLRGVARPPGLGLVDAARRRARRQRGAPRDPAARGRRGRRAAV